MLLVEETQDVAVRLELAWSWCIAVPLPFRKDRYFCLPMLWRLYRKEGEARASESPLGAAAELARKLAEANPGRSFWLVGDSAYINAALLSNRPEKP